MLRVNLSLGLLLLLFAPRSLAAEQGNAWEPIADKDGIQVWQKKVAGSPFVAFRGQMVMNASLKKLIAVLYDQERKLEWMHDCVANEVITKKKLGNVIIYNRTAVNVMFVSDRDVVVETQLTVLEKENRMRINAWSVEHPQKPEMDNVVRMPKLKLIWDFRVVNKDLTEVTYEVQTDPGGWLPAWLVNRVSRDIPYNSLHKLNLQVQKPYPKAMAFVSKNLNWAPFGL